MKNFIPIKTYQSSDFAFTNLSHYLRRSCIAEENFCPKFKMLVASIPVCVFWVILSALLLPSQCVPGVLG